MCKKTIIKNKDNYIKCIICLQKINVNITTHTCNNRGNNGIKVIIEG